VPVHLRHPQATEDDLVESRVGPAGQEAVKLVAVMKRQQRIPQVLRTVTVRTGVVYSRCLTWAPCGDHCCVLYQCLLL
jgi:hypothetical protein